MNNTFRQVNNGRVSDQVRMQIKELIMAGHLHPGDQLPAEKELASQFGVSRVPVREAIISLEQFGLLEIKRGAGGGVFVATPSVEPFIDLFATMLTLGKASISELTEARLLIEPGVARFAALRAEAQDIQKLEESIECYQDVIDENAARSQADLNFHVRLAEASHNLVLNLTLKSLVHLLFKTVREHSFPKVNRQKGLEDHKNILSAVKAGDGSRAAGLMQEHVSKMVGYWK